MTDSPLTGDEFTLAARLAGQFRFHTLIAAAYRATTDPRQHTLLATAFPPLRNPTTLWWWWWDADVVPDGTPYRVLLAAAWIRANSNGRRKLHDINPALCADTADRLEPHTTP